MKITLSLAEKHFW